MNLPFIIKLPLFDLKYNKIKEAIDHIFELHEKYLSLHRECYFDSIPTEEDKENGKFEEHENVYMKDRELLMKKHIIGLTTFLDNDVDIWVLGIISADRTITIKFETEGEMNIVYEELMTWLIY